jgi:hypothetical protein
MAWINYNNEKYTMHIHKLQCLNCSFIIQGFDVVCDCNRVIIRNGQRTWPYFPVKDVSIWKSESGNVLPQEVLDHYFNLRREPDKTGTDTKTSTRTSRSTY